MKITLSKILLMFVLVFAHAANSGLYRGVDSEGNVIYSDKPFDNSEEFELPPISVMDTPKSKVKKKAPKDEEPAEFKYKDFDIVSPANKETIRNNPNITVSLKLSPVLNVEEGHSIWLLVDGSPVVKKSESTSLQIGYLDRGAHNIQALVKDFSGKIIVRTRTTLVYVHHTSVLQ